METLPLVPDAFKSPTDFLPWEKGPYLDLSWMPLAIRFKLDSVGLKISLEQWQAMSSDSRWKLLRDPFRLETDISNWQQQLNASLEVETKTQAIQLESGYKPGAVEKAVENWKNEGFEFIAPSKELFEYPAYLAIKIMTPNRGGKTELPLFL